MSGHVTELPKQKEIFASAAEVTALLEAADFTGASATLIGYGAMGKQYLKALQALRVKQIRVVGRSSETLEPLREVAGVETVGGGFEAFSSPAKSQELGIVAVPTASLLPAAKKLLSLGFRRILVEKPVSLRSSRIEELAEEFRRQEAVGACAYNRVAYPSFLECRSRVDREGGATSCAYTFTELISSDWEWIFPKEELNRWGVSNSLHPIGMAHALIGAPRQWSGFRKGSLAWHPSGSAFVGSGLSERGIPFSYHADWGSTGRWSVEIHTQFSSYRLCPLERLFRRVEAKADWQEIPLKVFAPQVKAGFAEQVAGMLDPQGIGTKIPLVSLSQAAAWTGFAEELFGYDPAPPEPAPSSGARENES
ncbi:MAG: Gfo/Idh/MocA family oxidoreductase [Candidatus Omnitrophica bacterium]|nr:Gfo/Idh/MocA family oxidoreductase [Candidatus Omnitrophota bacterium]